MPPLTLLHPKFWPTWLGIGLLALITRMPYSFQLKIGEWVGRAFHRIGKSRRKVAETNIALCFPEKSPEEQAALVRQIFIDNSIGLMETLMSWFRKPEFLLGRTQFHGMERIHKARAEGKGVLLLGAHYSTLDLAGTLFVTQAPASISYRPLDNPVMNFIMEKNRKKRYEGCFTRKDIRSFIRTLKGGGVLWYAQDQDFGRKNSVFVNFFGIPAATITATSRIAKAGDALVLPLTYFRRSDNSGYDIRVHPPLNIPSGDDVKDAQEANDFIESQLREHPSQYLWLHKRFKTSPDPKDKKGLRYKSLPPESTAGDNEPDLF